MLALLVFCHCIAAAPAHAPVKLVSSAPTEIFPFFISSTTPSTIAFVLLSRLFNAKLPAIVRLKLGVLDWLAPEEFVPPDCDAVPPMFKALFTLSPSSLPVK